jgi:hypothetical protein
LADRDRPEAGSRGAQGVRIRSGHLTCAAADERLLKLASLATI